MTRLVKSILRKADSLIHWEWMAWRYLRAVMRGMR